MNNKSFWMSIGIVVLLTTLVACAGSESQEPQQPQEPAQAAPAMPAPAATDMTPQEPEEPMAAVAAAEPAPPIPAPMAAPTAKPEEAMPEMAMKDVITEGEGYGGTLNIHRTTGPVAFDVARANGSVMVWNMSNERLLICDIDNLGPRGSNRTTFRAGNACPLAAITEHLLDSWEIPNDNTIIYRLKQGIHYADKTIVGQEDVVGQREMDAEDVALSLTRLQNVPRFMTGYWAFVNNIEATDKYTVQFNLNFFNANWKWLFGPGWYNSIYPRELVHQDLANQWEYVTGTGPYLISDYEPDVGATYERNPDHWGTTSIDGEDYQLPFTDKIRQVVIPDKASYLTAFRTGKLDLVAALTPEERQDMLNTVDHELQEFIAPAVGGTKTLGMRVDMEPTSDLKVRKALAMGINWEDFHEKIFNNNSVRRYYLLVPEGWSTNLVTPVEELPDELVEGHTYNPDGAKALLAEAGYANGFSATMDIANDEVSADMASLLVAYWKDIGLDVDINTIERSAFNSTLHQGGHNIIGLYPLADPPLAAIGIGSVNSTYNWSRWSPPGYEEKLVDTLQETDPEVLAEKVKELNLMHALGFHLMQMGVPFGYNMAHPWVGNWYGEVDLGHSLPLPVWSRVQIDESMK